MSKNHVQLKQSLSALMDDEASEMEVRRVLKQIPQDDELRDTWKRYQMAVVAMRRELPEQIIDYSAGIRSALESEPALRVQNLSLRRIMKPLGRFAVAASVAAIAVVGVQQFNSGSMVSTSTSIAAINNTQQDLTIPQLRTASEFGIPPVTARTVSTAENQRHNYAVPHSVMQITNTNPDHVTRAQVQAYLNDLMLQHTENAAVNTNQGMLPFARMPGDEE